MSDIRVISPDENIIEEMCSLLKGADLSKALVIFPGKRPAHFLRKALAQERNKSFIPPRILSYDEFVSFFSERHLGMAGSNLTPLDATSILYDIHCSTAERLGGDHFTTYDQFLPLGFQLFDELEELLLADITPKRIGEKIGGLTFGNRHLLPRYFEQFYVRLKSENRLTRSLRLRAIAERMDDIDLSSYERIVLAGFYALTPTDRKIFSFLGTLDQTAFVYQRGPGLGIHLEALGFDGGNRGGAQIDLFGDENTGKGRPGKSPRFHLIKTSDTHGQMFALSACIRSLLDRNETLDERTVIVLPSSDTLFPVLHQPLALLPEDGYNISLGFPLSRTPLYSLLRNLLDLAMTEEHETVQAAAYTRLVLHPYVKNLKYGNRSDITRILFHAIEEFLSRRSATSVNLEALESEHALFERVAKGLVRDGADISPVDLQDHLRFIHTKVVRPFLRVKTIGTFAGTIADLVVLINETSTAHLHPLFTRYAERVLELAEEMRLSDASARTFEEQSSLTAFLRSSFGSQTVPFPGTPLRGVQVLGLLETRSLSFDRVFVLDASDDILPGSKGAEMLVPQGVRETMGLETARERERLIEYYFSNLLASAKEVYLFYSENNKQERSRFIEKLIWNRLQQHKDATGDAPALARYRIHLSNDDPSAIPKTREIAAFLKEFTFSATALDEYLKCPLQFYYHHVLGLREKEEVGDEIDQLDVGKIIHAILKRFFEPLKEKPLQASDVSEQHMSDIVHAVIGEIFGSHPKGSALLFRQQTESKLAEFLTEYQKKILETQSVEIIGIEREISILRDGHHFTGRIDRIERRGEETFILDYKIRQDDVPYKIMWKKFRPEERETWGDAIGSLQLPMYSLLYAEESGEPVHNLVPAYLFLGRNYLDPTIETGLSRDGTLTEEMHSNLHKVIVGLAKEIKDPKVPFTPTADVKKQCPRCPYQTLCGTQWAREGRW